MSMWLLTYRQSVLRAVTVTHFSEFCLQHGGKKSTGIDMEQKCVTVAVCKKGSPYSITERRVPALIPVLGSQPASDVSHKPGCRLSLLSARPAVTPATLKRAATNFAAWWTEARWVIMGVNSLPKTVTRQRRECDLNPGLLCLSPAR